MVDKTIIFLETLNTLGVYWSTSRPSLPLNLSSGVLTH